MQYLLGMCKRGLGLSPLNLKMKVYKMTKNCVTPFKNGISSDEWLRWFKHHHLAL